MKKILWAGIVFCLVALCAMDYAQADLYVSDGYGNNVSQFDDSSGVSQGLFANTNLNWARGLAFGPDGNLYVSSLLDNTIVRFYGATGAYIDDFATTNLSGPQGILFGPDGNLYVSNFFTNNVVRFDGTTGAYIDDFATGITNPTGLTFGGTLNDLFVLSRSGSSGNNEVLQFDGTTGVSKGVFANGLDSPVDLVFGPTGDLFVTNFGAATQNVMWFDGITGTSKGVFAADDDMSRPTGLAFGLDGNLYVSNQTQVSKFDGQTGATIQTDFATGLTDAYYLEFYAPVPEPSAILLFGSGLLYFLKRKYRK